MDKSTSNKQVLNTIFQTADMGVSAINDIYPAIEDERLIMLMLKQKDKYDDIIKKCQKLATKYSLDINKLNVMLKATSYVSIKMKSMFDNSTAHLSEMLIQGTTMGITSLLKTIGENDAADEKIRQTANDLQSAMEEFVDSLKVLLVK